MKPLQNQSNYLMDHLTYFNRMDYLLEVIEKGQLSSPHDLTNKFECTERTVRKMINDLRIKGYEIKYSKKNAKYFIDKK